jgi:hypothetical protein
LYILENLLELAKDAGKMSMLRPRGFTKPPEETDPEIKTDKDKVVIDKSNILMLGPTGSG